MGKTDLSRDGLRQDLKGQSIVPIPLVLTLWLKTTERKWLLNRAASTGSLYGRKVKRLSFWLERK
jgi:hypothetical protein|uniref:Uncharacterized protein n=1 Tax=Picea glauca TaxID=3330 RepID=A0A101LY20_PICGL|nr:hypothetical protein ABT39_MTgene5596 [Picea glauca]